MMLHRHFEAERNRENMTTLRDISPKPEKPQEPLPTIEPVEAPKKRGRKPKTAE